MSFYSSCINRSNNSSKDRYKAFLGVCKFQHLDYNTKIFKDLPHATLLTAVFKSILNEKNIKLPSFEDFKSGKTIHFVKFGFYTSNRSVDLNSTVLFANAYDPLEQLHVKKESVERYLNLKNNIEINKTAEILYDSSIDVTLLQAFENEIIFDLPEPESYKKNNFGNTYLPTAVKRKYDWDLNDITRSKVKIVDDKYKTSAKSANLIFIFVLFKLVNIVF